MSPKQAFTDVNRGPAGSQPARALIAILFFVLTAGYVLLYFASELQGSRVESRGQLLFQRLMLPEQAALGWFGWPPSIELSDRLPVLLTALGIMFVSFLTGSLLLAAMRAESPTPNTEEISADSALTLTGLERFVFACGIGLNAVSLYVLAMGLAASLDRIYFFVPAAIIVAIAAWQMWKGRPAVAAVHSAANDGISRKWLVLALPFAAVILLGGLLPPIDFDVREYHLQAPKEFYRNGAIGFLRHNVYGNMPLGSEMFSLLGMVLLDDWWLGALVGKTVIAAFAPLTSLALFAAGRRFASQGAGIVAAVLYLSIPWVSIVSTQGLIEGALAFYLFLTLYAALLWSQSARATSAGEFNARRWTASDGCLTLAGFCSGGAASCKYPAVLFVVLPLTVFVVWKSARRPFRPLAILLTSVIAGCGLWFAKNWVLTGNPVYPLLYDWLGGETRTPEINARWLRAHLPHQFGISSLAESLATVALTSNWISPVLAPLAVLGLFVPRYRRLAIILAGYFLYVVAAWWLFTHRIDRFWIPALPVLALLAGIGAVWSTSLAWRRAILATLVVGLSTSLIYVTAPEASEPGSANYNAYFVSLLRTRTDPDRINTWHQVLNVNVPQGYYVLSVGEVQVFDIEVPVIYNTVFDESIVAAIFENRSPDEIAAELRRQKISHVFVNWLEIMRYRQPGNYGGIPDFITQEWFSSLVQKRVLDEPWRMMYRPFQEVYPVIDVCAAAEKQAEVRVVNTAAGK